MNFSTQGFQKKVSKPWGEEIIYTPANLERTGKIIKIKAGQKLSFQYHEQKEETVCLISGQALLWLENSQQQIEKIPMQINFGYTIPSLQKHRIEALEDSVVIEVSSKEVGTTVRVEDDFGRPDETEEIRNHDRRL